MAATSTDTDLSAAAANRRTQAAAKQARTRTVTNRWLLLSPAVLVILVCGLAPLGIILFYSLMQPGDFAGIICCKVIPDAWINLFFEQDMFSDAMLPNYAYYIIFARSIGIALFTTAVSLGVGFPTAYFIATRSPKTRNLLLFLITIPFWTNMLIRAFAIQEVIRNEGIVNTLLMKLGLIAAPIPMMFSDFAILLGMTYVFLPLMVLPLYASIEKLDFRLIEAAYDLYASRWNVLFRVIVPLVKPGLIAGAILVFIPALSSYVIPRVLGGGKNLMIGNLIELQFGQGRNWPLGASLSVTLVIIVLVAMLYYVKNASKSGGAHG